jgi:hypothetical protein
MNMTPTSARQPRCVPPRPIEAQKRGESPPRTTRVVTASPRPASRPGQRSLLLAVPVVGRGLAKKKKFRTKVAGTGNEWDVQFQTSTTANDVLSRLGGIITAASSVSGDARGAGERWGAVGPHRRHLTSLTLAPSVRGMQKAKMAILYVNRRTLPWCAM